MSLIPFSFHSIVSRSASTSWTGTSDRRTWRDVLLSSTAATGRFALALRNGIRGLPTPAKLGLIGLGAVVGALPLASVFGLNDVPASKGARHGLAEIDSGRKPPVGSSTIQGTDAGTIRVPVPMPSMLGTTSRPGGEAPNAGTIGAPATPPVVMTGAPQHRLRPPPLQPQPRPAVAPRPVYVPPPHAAPVVVVPRPLYMDGQPRNFTPRPVPFGGNFTPWQRQEFTPRPMPFGGFGGPFRFQGSGMPFRGYGGGFGGGRMPFFNGGGSFGGFHGRR